MSYCCYKCGKKIRGNVLLITPPLFVTQLMGDTKKAYHHKCYDTAEREAGQELHANLERRLADLKGGE